MKIRNRINKLIAVAALAAGFLCGAGSVHPVQGQGVDGSVRFISYASAAIVEGERVRLSVSNTEESTGTLSLRLSYYLAPSDSSSTVPFYESELIQVPRGEFRFFDITRKDLNTEGEPRTRRARMLVMLIMTAPASSNPDDFPTSLAIIQDRDQDGNALQIDSKYRLVLLAAQRSKHLAPIGFGPGQRLSYTVFYPKEEGSQRASVTTYVYDSAGRLTRQTDPVELEPGQSHTFNINREDLLVPGEEGSGRLEVRAVVQVAFMDASVRPVQFPLWVELVDNLTGRTIAGGGTYFTGSVTVSGDGE